ncbi:MAG: PAS domain-containing protein [Pseudomonadota bacterium]
MSAEIVEFEARRLIPNHPVLTRVEAYWDGLRNGRDAPSRAEVDPRGLSGVLRHCFVLERIAPGLARVRVAGQAISDQMGLEMKGMPFSTLFLPEARDQLESVLERVFATPETARLAVMSPPGFKRRRVTGQLLLLPLRCDLGTTSRAMGCLVMDDLEGRRPRRLDITAADQRATTSRPNAQMRAAPDQTQVPMPQGDAKVITFRVRPDATV